MHFEVGLLCISRWRPIDFWSCHRSVFELLLFFGVDDFLQEPLKQFTVTFQVRGTYVKSKIRDFQSSFSGGTRNCSECDCGKKMIHIVVLVLQVYFFSPSSLPGMSFGPCELSKCSLTSGGAFGSGWWALGQLSLTGNPQ